MSSNITEMISETSNNKEVFKVEEEIGQNLLPVKDYMNWQQSLRTRINGG